MKIGGVPGAYLTGEKGDLCDPRHREWEKERKGLPSEWVPAPEPESWQDHHRWALDAEENSVCRDCGTGWPGDGPCDERPWTAEQAAEQRSRMTRYLSDSVKEAMMTRVKTACVVQLYEINGEKVAPVSIVVASHWNERSKVIITSNGQSVTVVAADLAAAIGKASGGP